MIEEVYALSEAEEYELSWSSEGAASYEVHVAGTDGTEVLNVNSTKHETVRLSAEELTPGEIYELRVKAQGEGGESETNASWYFMLNPTPTPESTPEPTPSPTAEPTPSPTAEPTPTSEPTPTAEPTPIPVSEWPVMRREGYYNGNSVSTVPGSEILRSSIASITFVNMLDGAPGDAWDVSEAGDGFVLAWITSNGERYDLTIAGQGGVRAPKDSGHLFASYENMTSLDFNGCFDTSAVTDMEAMFSGCSSLTTLDLSAFDTTGVMNMRWMFSGCSSLTTLDVSTFDTSSVTDMGLMFIGCSSLTMLDLSTFDTFAVRWMNSMFANCSSLTDIRFGAGFVMEQASTEGMFDNCPSHL